MAEAAKLHQIAQAKMKGLFPQLLFKRSASEKAEADIAVVAAHQRERIYQAAVIFFELHSSHGAENDLIPKRPGGHREKWSQFYAIVYRA